MKSKFKKRDLTALFAGIIIIVLVNFVSGLTFRRLDLTAEGRYTLTPPTIDLLNNIDDAVTIKVYLDGDLPAYFIKLKNATRDLLDEMRAFNDNIEYEFIDPSENPIKKEREKIYTQLAKKGLKYTQDDLRKEYYLFPSALITYKGIDIPVELLQVQNGLSKEAMCYNSINSLEYQFSNTFRKFDIKDKPKIGFIKGHGELGEMETDDIRTSLGEYYVVERVNIGGKLNSLLERGKDDKDTNKIVVKPKYTAIVIAKPDSAFTENDKFIIDQYLMYGGKIMWCIDNVYVSMDSLQANPATIAFPLQLNLEDMLFRYGVRVNTNMVMDLNAAPIPVVTEMVDGKPIQNLFPWYFYPIALPTSKHPIVKNLNGIRLQFANTVDTVGTNPSVKKFTLLHSSKYSRYINSPANISLSILRDEPDERQFDKRFLPMAVLLEGFFDSNYKNRVSPEIDTSKIMAYKDRSVFSRQIVVGDGDVLRNDVSKNQGKIFPLDFDRFTGATYGNKTFMLNALNFLCDDSGLISARAREVMVRPLDKKKVVKNKLNIQMMNVAFPTILVLLFGLIQFFVRKRKFAK
jgi:ABC-2 type transport system permease protein